MEGRARNRLRTIAADASVTPAQPTANKRKTRSNPNADVLEMGTAMLDPKTSELDAAHKQQRLCSTPEVSNVLQSSEPLEHVPPVRENHPANSVHHSGNPGPTNLSSQQDACLLDDVLSAIDPVQRDGINLNGRCG